MYAHSLLKASCRGMPDLLKLFSKMLAYVCVCHLFVHTYVCMHVYLTKPTWAKPYQPKVACITISWGRHCRTGVSFLSPDLYYRYVALIMHKSLVVWHQSNHNTHTHTHTHTHYICTQYDRHYTHKHTKKAKTHYTH